jgi:class 3 adenylate cyclase
LNKQFGTTILVSEAVYSRVEHLFSFEAFASVTAKGMTKETRVFELHPRVGDARIADTRIPNDSSTLAPNPLGVLE